MIVDDERDIADMLQLMLKKEGFKTRTAGDGKDFLKKIDRFDPDLVTLDVVMPGLKTHEILKKLKLKKSDPKIILLSEYRFTRDEKTQISMMGNVVGYLLKPFEYDEVTNVIKKFQTT